MSESDPEIADDREVHIGEAIYDEDGTELGHIRGIDEHGFYVTTAEGVVALSADHQADSRSGIKELNWRCWECGEIGQDAEIPEECPSCGAPKEELYWWQQD